MSLLNNSTARENWILQFDKKHQPLMAEWLSAIKHVSATEFREKIIESITKYRPIDGSGSRIALYAEREVKKWRGVSQRAYREKLTSSKKKGKLSMRAFGKAPMLKLIDPQRTVNPEIGSEGIVTNLLTQLMRSNRRAFLINPGPDQLRTHRVRHVVIVTDFIGSGVRTKKFLDCFWRHPTIKSWRSLSYIDFHVVCYSTTRFGYNNVVTHPIKPNIVWTVSCPTISSEYNKAESEKISKIITSYDPINNDPIESLGFGGQGAMLVFDHGCPNNAPRILYKSSKKWAPLYRERSNLENVQSDAGNTKKSVARLRRLLPTLDAKRSIAATYDAMGADLLLLLAAVSAGHKFNFDLSEVTGLELAAVELGIRRLIHFSWINATYQVTDSGRRQLNNARPFSLQHTGRLALSSDVMYYPKALRPPNES